MNFLTLTRLIKALENIFRCTFFVHTHEHSILIRNASQMISMIVSVRYTVYVFSILTNELSKDVSVDFIVYCLAECIFS